MYLAANTLETAAVAGEVGDGLMPFLEHAGAVVQPTPAAREAAARAGRRLHDCACVLSIPTFLSEDRAAARSAARYNLAFFAQLPNYRRQWRRAGFGEAMDAIRALDAAASRREIAALIPDALVDEVCVFGTVDDCRAQLAAFHAAGADLPVLAVSPVNGERLEATRQAIAALA